MGDENKCCTNGVVIIGVNQGRKTTEGKNRWCEREEMHG
jgi:hypothetical protein